MPLGVGPGANREVGGSKDSHTNAKIWGVLGISSHPRPRSNPQGMYTHRLLFSLAPPRTCGCSIPFSHCSLHCLPGSLLPGHPTSHLLLFCTRIESKQTWWLRIQLCHACHHCHGRENFCCYMTLPCCHVYIYWDKIVPKIMAVAMGRRPFPWLCP